MPSFCAAPHLVRHLVGPCGSPHAFARSRRRRILTSLSVAALAGFSLGACSGSVTEPDIDCDVVLGTAFIVLTPAPSGFATYSVAVGDSVQVVGSVRRVTESVPSFDVQQGWSCAITASSPVIGSVAFSTTDTDIVRLDPGGWIRALSQGLATVTATSTSPVVSTTFGVLAN